MVTFIVLAALALVVGVGAVTIPLLKRSGTPGSPPPAPWAAAVAAVVLVLGSALTYGALSNWSWKSVPADSPATMVARLARKLEQNPSDLEGWLRLGHAYVVLEQYGLAARAYERADHLSGGANADALVGEAEALTLEDDNNLAGPAGQLLEKALQLSPDSGKALFYGAAAAIHRGDLPLAKERFSKLLSMNPPDNIKQVLEQQITAIDQRLAGGPQAPGPGAGPEAGAQPPPAGGGDAAATAPAVRVTVQLPKGAAVPDPGKPLFVLVRDPDAPGPPLAVKRLGSTFPQTVELTSQDSIMGRTFAAGQKVEVVARISLSGNPLAGRGDPFGKVAYRVGRDGLVNITIDQVSP